MQQVESADTRTLHVRKIGADPMLVASDGVSKYEHESQLKALFEPYGEVEHISVRHRHDNQLNTSYALVTMRTSDGAKEALGSRVMAGASELELNLISKKQASASKGAMAGAHSANPWSVEDVSIPAPASKATATMNAVCCCWRNLNTASGDERRKFPRNPKEVEKTGARWLTLALRQGGLLSGGARVKWLDSSQARVGHGSEICVATVQLDRPCEGFFYAGCAAYYHRHRRPPPPPLLLLPLRCCCHCHVVKVASPAV
eukprot:COSAG05_NODE_3486_length_2031_cov_1.800207_1_plen_259_part_00